MEVICLYWGDWYASKYQYYAFHLQWFSMNAHCLPLPSTRYLGGVAITVGPYWYLVGGDNKF